MPDVLAFLRAPMLGAGLAAVCAFAPLTAHGQTSAQTQKPQPIESSEAEKPIAAPKAQETLAPKGASKESDTTSAPAVATRIGYIPVIGAAQIFVAEKEGYLKKAGIEPKFTTFESGPAMIQALASGSIDVYIAGIAPLAVARSKGVNVQVVAAAAVDEMTVIAGPKLAAFFKTDGSKTGDSKIIDPKTENSQNDSEPKIESSQSDNPKTRSPLADAFKAFREANGKPARLATQPPGSVPHTTLMHWLMEVVKADKADYEIVTMGIDATQMALLSGAVEAATLREPAVTITMTRASGAKLLAFGSQMFPKQPGTVVAVSGAFAAKNPKAVQGLTNAVVEATNILKSDPEKAAGPLEAVLGKGIVDKAVLVTALKSPASNFVSDPAVIVEPFQRMQAFQVQIGTLDQAVPIEGLINPSFYLKAMGR